MRTQARAVVIGGGVGGCSVLYWLARLGWDDVLLVERADLTSGSTFHSAGPRRAAARLTLADEDDDGLRRLPLARGRDGARDGLARGRLAAPRSSQERLEEISRQAGWARTFGLPLELIAGRGAGALPADVDRRRPRRRPPPHRRLRRPEPAHVRARRGSSPPRRRGRDQHACHGHPRRARAGHRGRNGGGGRDGDRRQRGRDVRAGAGGARGRDRPDRADGARVPDPQADRPPARHADDARPPRSSSTSGRSRAG